MTLISRRGFLAASAATLSTAALPRFAMAQNAISLSAATRVLDVNGRAAIVFGLEGPSGQGLVLNPGQRFRASLTNRLDVPTLIHWHGQIPPNEQDGVPDLPQPMLQPDETRSYDYEPLPGTYWMHAHIPLQEMNLLAAPLIVRNPTGNRGCEAALNKDFARFDAGAHPANTGKPEFAETPRGARVAGLLGLDLNPRSGRQRRAIEVYPLFRLGRTLKYKNKPGRDLESLRSELLALMGYLETVVVTAGEPWARLRDAVESATRKSELRVVEDQVDAVVCAYVGLFADTHPEATTTYVGPDGGWEDGYVVVPTLPDDLEPSPRRARPRADPVQAATQAYAARLPQGSATCSWCSRSSTRPASTTCR